MSHGNCVVENEYTLEPVYHNNPRHEINVAFNRARCHPPEGADAVYAIPRRYRVSPEDVEPVHQNYESNIRNNPMLLREKHLPANHEGYASSGDVVTQEPENIYDIPFHSVRRRSEQIPAFTVDGNVLAEGSRNWQKPAGLLVIGLVAVIFVTAIAVTASSKGSNQQGGNPDGSPTTNVDMTLQATTGIKTTQENGVIRTTSTSESTNGATLTEANGDITSEISTSESKNEALFTTANVPGYCYGNHWTRWFDRDNPSATGDWETLLTLRKENPGKICESPTSIDVQMTNGKPYTYAQEVVTMSKELGFYCKNELQSDGKCEDYRVRFCCRRCYWTEWFDRDDPTCTGDSENMHELRKENPGRICRYPRAVEGKVLSHVRSTGPNILTMNTSAGLVCLNKEQSGGNSCKDFAVRFYCCTV